MYYPTKFIAGHVAPGPQGWLEVAAAAIFFQNQQKTSSGVAYNYLHHHHSHYLGTEASSAHVEGWCMELPQLQYEGIKKNKSSIIPAPHPCRQCGYHLDAKVAGVICNSPRYYQESIATKKKLAGVAALHFCQHRGYHLSAKIGRAATAGVICSSPHCY